MAIQAALGNALAVDGRIGPATLDVLEANGFVVGQSSRFPKFIHDMKDVTDSELINELVRRLRALRCRAGIGDDSI